MTPSGRSVHARPVKVMAGETFGVYVHSQQDNDQGLVYDNSSHRRSAKTEHLMIESGMAHLNCVPFLSESPWGGGWGRGQGWRNNREFVGKIDYGVRWLLWDPTCTKRFPKVFQQVAYNFITAGYRPGSLVSVLPQEIVLFILNMVSARTASSLANLEQFGKRKKGQRKRKRGGWRGEGVTPLERFV